jgi:cobalt/nickel transport system permease protein
MKVLGARERVPVASYFLAFAAFNLRGAILMHMADALVSPAVGGTMIVASGAAIAWTIWKDRKEYQLDDRKVPVMGVMSAFVFAAQMINFTIPGTGSSGHIGGGILLAALLGGGPALLCLTAVLVIQCLLFADGGLLALGCNIFNMGVIPCLLAYPLVYKPLTKNGVHAKSITIASVLAVVIGLQLGAFSVVLETKLSGITLLPFGTFLLMMQPIHLAIGIVEGLITASVLVYVGHARPELLESARVAQPIDRRVSLKQVLAVLGILALLVGGGLSLLASSNPDGLEWSVDGVLRKGEAANAAIAQDAGEPRAVEAQGAVYDTFAGVQEKTSLMPDYAFKGSDSAAGTSVAGVVGSAAALLVAVGAGALITRAKRKSA